MAGFDDGVVQLIVALRDLFKSPEAPKQPTLVESLTTLKKLGIISPKGKDDETTMLEKLKLLKDALGLKYAHEVGEEETDPVEMVEKVQGLITALRPWVKATSPSTRELVLEAFSKHGGPLFETIRNLGRIKKLEVQSRTNLGERR